LFSSHREQIYFLIGTASPTTTSPEITYAAPELLSAAIVSYAFHLGAFSSSISPLN
jgi:hypothetical protein